MTKSLILAAKALFAAGIVWFLFARGYLDLADLGEIARRPWTVIVPGILVFLTLPLMTWRWSILLRSQGVTVPFMGAFRVTVAGMLANTFVLNSVGIDVLRGTYVWRKAPERYGVGLMSLVADRFCGLHALVSLAAAASVWQLAQGPGGTLMQLVLGFVWAVFAAATLAPLVVYLLVLWLNAHTAAGGPLRRIGEWRLSRLVFQAVQAYRHDLGGFLRAWAISLSIQLCGVVAVVLVARVVAPDALSAVAYAFAGATSMLFNALPLTPGGIGLGEGAFSQICRLLEHASSGFAFAGIFLAYRTVSVLALLAGLLVYLQVGRRYDADDGAPEGPPQSGLSGGSGEARPPS